MVHLEQMELQLGEKLVDMAKGYSYVVARDYGFAPNPFRGYCTLATCKPNIRRSASIGDYVFGFTPSSIGRNLVFAMKVSEKLTFNQYWDDPRFQYKKPIVQGGTVKTAYGDNIYVKDKETNKWSQSDSHHSYENGVVNSINMNRDTSADSVLIATEFFYFGSSSLQIPNELLSILTLHSTGTPVGLGHKPLTETQSLEVWEWLTKNYDYGITEFPTLYIKGFARYDGN